MCRRLERAGTARGRSREQAGRRFEVDPRGRQAAAGLYLHVPFCSAVCPYCDFAVTTGSRESRARFVALLVAEIELHAGCEVEFDTIYFGGGTPSLLAREELASVLEALARTFRLADDLEVCLEANPEDVRGEQPAEWRRLGVSRLSLGVQAFDAAALRFLGRRHDPETARRSVTLARAAGIPSVSLDLIYALPRSSRETWVESLEEAVRLEPDHIACYELTVHAGTPFGRWAERGDFGELGEEERSELFELTHTRLAAAGYDGYEVSNFARSPAHRSRHNTKYWRHVPYLGLGPSAHSFDGRRRFWNERTLGPYAERLGRGLLPVAGEEELALEDLVLEAVMLALRTRDGLDLSLLRDRFGVELEVQNRQALDRLVAAGLVEVAAEQIRPTLRGLAVADRLAVELELGVTATD